MRELSILVAIVLLAGCQTQTTREPARFKTIMLKAEGEVETLPNHATFSIRLNCLDKSVKASKKCLVEKSNELNRKLISLGIAEADILTTSVDMTKSYSWSRNTRIFEGYNSSTELYVTVKVLENLDEVYTELLENRNLEIGRLSYSHAQLDSLKNEAYLKALKNANTLADKLLTGLPESKKEILKVGNVKLTASIPEGHGAEVGNVVADETMEVSATTQSQSIAISKGTVKVNATLFVEYLVR